MKTKIDRNISEKIKKFRIKQGWTQQMLADHLGINRTQISAWERNGNKTNVITVKYLTMEGIL